MTKTLEKVDNVREQATALLKALCSGLHEREEPMHLAFLTAVAGESIFLLGPPGVGKSLIARRLKYAFKDGTSFEYLMSKFSTPDEVFGPVSIKKLKEEDKYERLTEKYLPGANIVFLDEIWKAGPAIQNALLTILNEKIYRNGEEDIPVDIHGIITASNELPPKTANLAPIWDRFLVRYEMGNIKQFQNFLNMIVDTKDVYEDDIPVEVKLTNEQLQSWSKSIDEVELTPEVLNTIQLVKTKLIEHNARSANAGKQIIVHDRRWKKLVRLFRTSAFLNGRQQADLMDCFLMIHCLWGSPEDIEVLRNIVIESIANHGYSLAVNLNNLKKEVEDFQSDVDKEMKIEHISEAEELMTIEDEYFELVKTDSKFKGKYLTIKQYRELSMSEEMIINFYDNEKNLVNRIGVMKGKEKNTIVIMHDSKANAYKLVTKIANKKEVIMKAPHPIVQKYWDERYQKLTSFIQGHLERIESDTPNELTGLEQHFFVDSEFATIVRKNMNEIETSLKNLNLQLEKLQFAYTNV